MSRVDCALAGILLVAVGTAFAPSLADGFVWDDQTDIVHSDRLRAWSSVGEVFRHPALWAAGLDAGAIPTYRPLAEASFVVDYQMHGLSARGYHLTSVLAHALASVVTFALLRRFAVGGGLAFALALACALHPSTVEAVTWVNGRSEVLLWLLGGAALCVVRGPASRWRPPVVALLLFGAMLAKETGVVLAAVCVAAAAIPRRTPGAGADESRRRWPTSTALAALAATVAYLALRTAALGSGVVPRGLSTVTIARALPAVWWRAAEQLAWPVWRTPVPVKAWLEALSPLSRALAIGGGLLVAAAPIALLVRRRYAAALGVAWWLAALVPAAWTVAVSHPWPGLSRWLYVGLPGIALAVASLAPAPVERLLERLRVPPRARPVACAAPLVAVAVAWLVVTERAIPTWHDEVRFFTTMTEEWPGDAWSERYLGLVLIHARRVAEAVPHLEASILADTSAEVESSYALLSVADELLDRCDDGVAIHQAHPPTAMLLPGGFDEAAGSCYARAGRVAEALARYRACAGVSPSCAAALSRYVARLRAPR